MTRRPGIDVALAAMVLLSALVLTACGTESATDPGGGSAIHAPAPPLTARRLPTTTVPMVPTWRPERTQHGPCTKAGTAISVGPVEPALGHRAVVIQVRNCGWHSLVVDGYPVVKLLDTHRRQLAVTVKRDSSYMAIDTGPERYRLKPGRHLVSVIAWSATVTDPDPAKYVRAAYLVIASGNGQLFQAFWTDADLGTTTELDASPGAPSSPTDRAADGDLRTQFRPLPARSALES